MPGTPISRLEISEAPIGRLAFPGFKGILVVFRDAMQPNCHQLRLILSGTIVEENRNEFCAT